MDKYLSRDITFCAVKDGRAYVGSRADVLSQVCRYWLSEGRELHSHFHGFSPSVHHSYSDEYPTEGMNNDIVQFLFGLLPKYGYAIFKSTDK